MSQGYVYNPYEYLPSPSPNSSDEILSEIRRQDVEQAVTFSLFSPNASVFLTSSDIDLFDDTSNAMAATSVHLANQSLDASPDSSRESWSQLSLCNNRSDINGNSSTTDSFTLSSNIIASSNDQQHTSPVDFIDSHFTSDVVSKGIYEKLRIVAQPRASYRERYQSEMAPARNGAQRFIRAEEGSTYEYPTISLPLAFSTPEQQFFIRVTLITIASLSVPYACIHPYAIQTPEENVITDPEKNSLYFPISDAESLHGEKSFHIIRRKMIQSDLRSYGLLRRMDSDQFSDRLALNLNDPKTIINAYQLWKSKLVFTLAERRTENGCLMPLVDTSVESHMTVDALTERPSMLTADGETVYSQGGKCIPSKGDWDGGDEVVLILPIPVKRKAYDVLIQGSTFAEMPVPKKLLRDTKTILFQTPPCPLLPNDQNVAVFVVLKHENVVVARFHFDYLTPIRANCPNCTLIRTHFNASNKRRGAALVDCVTDGGESLAAEMDRLSIGQDKIQPASQCRPKTSSEGKDSKLDRYFNQLKDAVAEFVRTNNPSLLFRRTRCLLSNCDGDSPPLHDAIERGHEHLALALIEQAIEMSTDENLLDKLNSKGETPLLVAAKFNRGELVEAILKARPYLARHMDWEGNNLLHLLAGNEPTSDCAEILSKVLSMLPDDLKRVLLREKNMHDRSALDIAQCRGNTLFVDRLTSSIDRE